MAKDLLLSSLKTEKPAYLTTEIRIKRVINGVIATDNPEYVQVYYTPLTVGEVKECTDNITLKQLKLKKQALDYGIEYEPQQEDLEVPDDDLLNRLIGKHVFVRGEDDELLPLEENAETFLNLVTFQDRVLLFTSLALGIGATEKQIQDLKKEIENQDLPEYAREEKKQVKVVEL